MATTKPWFDNLKWLLPKFIREDYSPYKCRVSANRENYDLRARRIHLQNMVKTWVNTGENPSRTHRALHHHKIRLLIAGPIKAYPIFIIWRVTT